MAVALADSTAYVRELVAIGERAGLDAVGITSAEPLLRARAALVTRKAAGLAADMQFTYKNPTRSTTPAGLVKGARSVVVGARNYLEVAGQPAAHAAGDVARYAWRDHYGPLRDALGAVAAQLRGDGYRAVVVADENSMVDREIAHRAGIGWFGKNANLLLPGRGSWFVLGSVITDAPMPATSIEPVADGCGGCRRCFDGCPTGAIVAAGVVDANRCLAWLAQRGGTFPVEFREALGSRIYGCDDCQEVCPPNIRFGRSRPNAVVEPPVATVDLAWLLTASDDEILAGVGRWYIADRQPRWLRRNALIALGNLRPLAAGGRCLLERYAACPDEVLAEHARWALDRHLA